MCTLVFTAFILENMDRWSDKVLAEESTCKYGKCKIVETSFSRNNDASSLVEEEVMVEAEQEEVEEEVVVVVLMALLRLWDMLYNDFERNPLMKNNWVP